MRCNVCDREVETGAAQCPLGHDMQEHTAVAIAVVPSETAGTEPSIWFASSRSEVTGRADATTPDGRESPASVTPTKFRGRLKTRKVAIGLGGLLVAGLLTAGVLSDIKTRQSLNTAQGDLSTASDKLKVANAQLASQSSQLSNQAAELEALRAQAAQDTTTITDQKGQLAGAADREQQLTACNGALAAFLQDLVAKQYPAADRDYRTAYRSCAAVSVELPLP